MNIAENITDLIGNTPLIKIKTISKSTGAEIIGKMESFNPLSSVKDRIAFAMILDAEKKGLIKKGDLIVEATSGNTGVGLAYIAASRGYRCILTMPDSMSIERRKILTTLGAKLVLTPASEGMNGSVTRANEIIKKNPGSFKPDQFSNPANPEIHRQTTVKEIIRDTDGKIDIFIAGIGTGGTITGCGEVLKEYNSRIQVIAVEPEGSAVLSGDPPGPHKIQGIGAGFTPKILNTNIYDEIIKIESGEAADIARRMAKKEGIFIGISSGAALKAAEIVGKRPENKGKRIIVILPDTGERYLSTWIFE
ncbi:MAG: cysteine synthase A [Spirochaetota bacterium]|nr:cysteine synthase A [Spirochaetota bacterium]